MILIHGIISNCWMKHGALMWESGEFCVIYDLENTNIRNICQHFTDIMLLFKNKLK